LPLPDPGRKLDVHFLTVVESAYRTPRRIVAFDRIAEAKTVDVECAGDRRRGIGHYIVAVERDEVVLRGEPGDRRHIGLLGRAKLEMVRAPISVDDEIGDEIRPGRLDKDVNLLGRRRSALGISDDPAHRVAGRNWPGADELLTLLQRDIGDLTG